MAIFVASTGTDVENVTVDGNLFDKVGGGSLDFDSSLVYTSTTGALSRIVNNTFTSVNNGQPGSFGLRTAIEIHGKNMLVENNRISGFIIGLNTGGDSPDGTVLNLVRNNLFKNVNSGVVVWGTRSDNGATTTACNLSILDNVITLNVNGWQNHPQARDAAFSGIRVEQDGSDSDRQISNLDITGNTISFFNFSGTTHINGYRWSNGINYNRSWLSSSQNLTQNLHISHNKITNSPASGIVLYAPVFEGEIANNTVTNPGSSTGASGWRGWQSGVFLQNSQENLTVIGNQFIDNQTTKSLQQGIYAINDVHGYNVESGNSVSGAQAPVFVRGNDAGSGNWTTAPTAPHIDKFYLYYENGASAVSGFDPLRSGSVINLKQLTGTVAVRIVSPAPVGSVKIRIETPNGTTESIKNEEWFYVYLATPSVGSYRITATPFSGSDATGTQGIARNIVFHVINETVR